MRSNMAMAPTSPELDAQAAGEIDALDMGDEKANERMRQGMAALISRLQIMADEQVTKRTSIEDRWYEDLRQYYGRYEAETESKLKAAKKSTVFVNLTRTKTHAWEARLSDMLFPTDDRNWGIRPTPVPELADAAKQAVKRAQSLVRDANDHQTAAAAAAAGGDAAAAAAGAEAAAGKAREADALVKAAAEAKAIQDEAARRAEAMEREIDDQLVEAEYNIKSRDIIHDACKLGTGIMKGPIIGGRVARRWKQIEATDQAGNAISAHALVESPDPQPDWQRVDPWSFFPDMNASRIGEAEFTFERHLMTRADLRKLAKLPGFDKDAIRRLLNEEPRDSVPPYVARLLDITGGGQNAVKDRYQVWEYRGPLKAEDLRSLCHCMGDAETMDDIAEADPLDEHQAVVWFCQNEAIKFGLHFMDSGEPIYSVFNLEADDQSIFGFGVPYLMRDSQRALNGAWRMIMDNAALSTGPQVVIDMQALEPADGSWTLTPRKVWRKKDKSIPAANVFGAFNIDSRQEQLGAIIAMAKQFADDETSLPLVAQGESGINQTQTANGMSMLMNSVNVVFRRVVKNYDDGMTCPNIRRSYDWNMQFSVKDNIKGDFSIDARGSSVLLVREIQAQNLMAMTLQFAAHPVLGGLTKVPALYRKLVQAHMLPADEIVKTDEEIEREQEAAAEAANQGGAPDPESMRAETQMKIAQIDAESRLKVAEINRETAMMRLAEDRNMQVEDLRAKFDMKHTEIASKERTFAAEAALRERTGAGI